MIFTLCCSKHNNLSTPTQTVTHVKIHSKDVINIDHARREYEWISLDFSVKKCLQIQGSLTKQNGWFDGILNILLKNHMSNLSIFLTIPLLIVQNSMNRQHTTLRQEDFSASKISAFRADTFFLVNGFLDMVVLVCISLSHDRSHSVA